MQPHARALRRRSRDPASVFSGLAEEDTDRGLSKLLAAPHLRGRREQELIALVSLGASTTPSMRCACLVGAAQPLLPTLADPTRALGRPSRDVRAACSRTPGFRRRRRRRAARTRRGAARRSGGCRSSRPRGATGERRRSQLVRAKSSALPALAHFDDGDAASPSRTGAARIPSPPEARADHDHVVVELGRRFGERSSTVLFTLGPRGRPGQRSARSSWIRPQQRHRLLRECFTHRPLLVPPSSTLASTGATGLGASSSRKAFRCDRAPPGEPLKSVDFAGPRSTVHAMSARELGWCCSPCARRSAAREESQRERARRSSSPSPVSPAVAPGPIKKKFRTSRPPAPVLLGDRVTFCGLSIELPAGWRDGRLLPSNPAGHSKFSITDRPELVGLEVALGDAREDARLLRRTAGPREKVRARRARIRGFRIAFPGAENVHVVVTAQAEQALHWYVICRANCDAALGELLRSYTTRRQGLAAARPRVTRGRRYAHRAYEWEFETSERLTNLREFWLASPDGGRRMWCERSFREPAAVGEAPGGRLASAWRPTRGSLRSSRSTGRSWDELNPPVRCARLRESTRPRHGARKRSGPNPRTYAQATTPIETPSSRCTFAREARTGVARALSRHAVERGGLTRRRVVIPKGEAPARDGATIKSRMPGGEGRARVSFASAAMRFELGLVADVRDHVGHPGRRRRSMSSLPYVARRDGGQCPMRIPGGSKGFRVSNGTEL